MHLGAGRPGTPLLWRIHRRASAQGPQIFFYSPSLSQCMLLTTRSRTGRLMRRSPRAPLAPPSFHPRVVQHSALTRCLRCTHEPLTTPSSLRVELAGRHDPLAFVGRVPEQFECGLPGAFGVVDPDAVLA